MSDDYQAPFHKAYMEGIADGVEPCAAGPWIPVTERLPESTRDEVLVNSEDDGITVARWSGERWISGEWKWHGRHDYVAKVTHWAEIRGPK